jgi:hypothetical protein
MARTPSTACAGGRLAPRLLAFLAALPLAACSDHPVPTAPTAAGPARSLVDAAATLRRDRLATIEQEGATEVLYLQNADGSGRVRVHFQNVHDHVAGNYSSSVLPVTDETIRAIRRAKWSSDGQQLAVVVVPALDASQVVLVSADGHDLRTVSPNSQYLFGDVEWSPDSRRIAYAMSTGPYASWPDLFVTDLGPDQVRRVTTSGKLSGYDTFRFDPTGQRLLFTEHLGWAEDGVNVLSRLAYADLAAGTVVAGHNIVGEPQGFARDGSWGLFIRSDSERESTRELVRVPLRDGVEAVLATGDVWNAVLLEGDREAVVNVPDPNDRTGAARSFRMFGVDAPNDVRATLPTGPNVTWAALEHASR